MDSAAQTELLVAALARSWEQVSTLPDSDMESFEVALVGRLDDLGRAGDSGSAARCRDDILALFASRPAARQLLDREIALLLSDIDLGPDRIPPHLRGADRRDWYLEVPVFYATDRKPDGIGFGGERGDLDFGIATVGIPHGRRIAERPRARLRFRKPGTTGDLPVEVIDSRPWGSEELGADADVLLFVHGYNTAFDRAARWAATIAYDLRFPGVIALYSWPSRGRRTSYAADAESADVAVWNFRRVLRRLLDQPVSRGVHIVAYSAGCSVVLRAFESGELRDAAAVHGRVENIVFSAPDIDADLFAKLIPNCTAVNRRCTLYVSENDRVLALSGAVAGYPRAGHARRRVVVRPEVDTIDVSYLDTGAKGHGYLAEHERVIADLHQLIVNGKPPQQRFGLDRVAHSGGGYWTFAPSASRA